MNIPARYPSINQRRRQNESEKMKSIMAARRQIEIIAELQQAGLDIGDLGDNSLLVILGVKQ
ncbi:hypothetical protein [Vibrio scophthalmi]|uniref:Uncharacterized protein n=1 Tax=Vibrio scophthalmi LMG 19158 TaxID=870967 RepID=F9RNA7_9VIBR|nr:hypothetical protein [Vibrio scophthalmi]EGU37252.1 hypothetical protein VIS19158_03557 [Vibrio scophthalmi LMG 19158]